MVYNITDFGAIPSSGLCTKEVQAAIDACYLAGGGEVARRTNYGWHSK